MIVAQVKQETDSSVGFEALWSLRRAGRFATNIQFTGRGRERGTGILGYGQSIQFQVFIVHLLRESQSEIGIYNTDGRTNKDMCTR